jgi:S-adenosylmethionine:tRNA ribosyltransferase-isomerase
MPSAGRPVTDRTFRRLRLRGIRTASVVLHCGLSSPEQDEAPYAEWFSVPPSTVDAVREIRAAGGRVIAIGTTVVRAQESAARTGRKA